MKNLKIIIIALLLFLYLKSTAQTEKINSLIVAEFRMDDTPTGDYTYLVSYNFKEGKLISKDTLFGALVTRDGIPGSYIRFGLGVNSIYKDRYLISGIGNVIDLRLRKAILIDADDFIGLKGDSLFFFIDDLYRGDGYLILDLKRGKSRFIRDRRFKNFKDMISPYKAFEENFRKQSNNFVVSEQTDSIGRVISYKNELIGKVWCYPYHTLYNDNYFAAVWGETGKKLGSGSTQGFKVWNSISREWTSFKIPWMCDIVGWIEK